MHAAESRATQCSTHRPRMAILASGRGSNAAVLMDHFNNGFLPADLVAVLSNVTDAPVLDTAKAKGFTAHAISHRGLSRAAHEAALLDYLATHHVDHILLAGYMRILSPAFLRAFGGTVINIHPALLPDFPGLHGAEQQWHAGVAIAGATVHVVDEGVDTGPVLLQGSLIVRGDEGPEGLAARILTEVEHVIYPRAVRLFLDRLQRAHAAEAAHVASPSQQHIPL